MPDSYDTPRFTMATAGLVGVFTMLAVAVAAESWFIGVSFRGFEAETPTFSKVVTPTRTFFAYLATLAIVAFTVFREKPDEGFLKTWWLVAVMLVLWVFMVFAVLLIPFSRVTTWSLT